MYSCFQRLADPPIYRGFGFASRITKGLVRIGGMPEGKGRGARRRALLWSSGCGRLGGGRLAPVRAAFISDRGAVQATIWAALFVWASHGLRCVTGRHSARPVGRSQNKINRAQYSGISACEDYKPVMQRWSSQRQRYRPCPDAPGWPAISSCSPGARQPRASLRERRSSYAANRPPQPKNKSSVVLCHLLV